MLDWIIDMMNNTFGWLLGVWENYGTWIIMGLVGFVAYMMWFK